MMENVKVETGANTEVKMAAETPVEIKTEPEMTAGIKAELETDAETMTAAVKETVTEVILQYRGYEMNMDDVTERVKDHFLAKGNKPESIESMQIYVKPEDFTAYYVINDGVVGKVNLF